MQSFTSGYFLILVLLCGQRIVALWPFPTTITAGQDTLVLSSDFTIRPEFAETPQDLTNAIARTQGRLFNDKLNRLVVGRGSSDVSSVRSAKTLTSLRLVLISGNTNNKSEASIKSISDEIVEGLDSRIVRESYSLSVPSDGQDALLTASTTLGLLRGLSTFEQMWYTYDEHIYALNLPLNITDKPAYAYRGFMLDTSRNL